MRETAFPFFIQWDGAAHLHPGRGRVAHQVKPQGVAWVEVAGTDQSLMTWLDGGSIPLRITKGEPLLAAVGIATDVGEVVLR